MTRARRTGDAAASEGIFARRYLLPTIGTVAIVAVSAFQNLAMTTIMPEISRDLDGESLYSLSFAAPLAAGVPGMVIAGNWADRAALRVVTAVSAAVFALGTLVVTLAITMPMFLAGRLLEGFGAGALTVVLYVVVSRIYPERLHAPIFAGFAAAWVVPGVVGPAIAGVVTDLWNWHWVFAGSLAIAAVSYGMLAPSLRALPAPDPAGRPMWHGRRIAWSAVAAAAVLALNLAQDLPLAAAVIVLVVGLAVTRIALQPLLPERTFRAASGLPTVVLLRGIASAAFLGAEAYLPYLLQTHHGFSASLAGIALTLAAISWAGASWLHGRIPESLLTSARVFRIGFALVLVGPATACGVAAAGLPAVIAIAGWFVAGAGMGVIYPRTSTLTLRLSSERDHGFASAALGIGDATGTVVGLAIGGVAFAALGGAAASQSFAVVFGAMGVIAIVGLLLAPRLGPVPLPDASPVPAGSDR